MSCDGKLIFLSSLNTSFPLYEAQLRTGGEALVVFLLSFGGGGFVLFCFYYFYNFVVK